MSRIEHFYPLSPLQQGLLFHLLAAPTSGQYFEQLTCQLDGELDAGALLRAWRQVLGRHAVLRTSLVWRDVKEPVQVVHRRVPLPLVVRDWRRLPAARQGEELEHLLAAERRRGFDLTRPPLLRLVLVRLEARRHLLAWSYSHLLLDGWSVPLVLQEVMACYRAVRRGEVLALPPARPFRHYVAWLRRQDAAAAEGFWRRALAGLHTPTDLQLEERPAATGDFGELRLALPEALTGALATLCRHRGLTLNTVCCAAWALLLARGSGQQDVLFGLTLAGRPPQLAGVEAMVGLFINTLPVRVGVSEDAVLGPWLGELQALLGELQTYQHTPLATVQGWSEVPRGQPLFDSLVVFENYPASPTASFELDGLTVRPLRFTEHTHYPLTLSVIPGAGLTLELAWQRQRTSDTAGRRRLGQLVRLLRALVELEAGASRLGELPLLAPAERHQVLWEWSTTPGWESTAVPVLALLAQRAATAPDAVALVAEPHEVVHEAAGTSRRTRAVSYRQLLDRVDRLARRLRRRGVVAEMPVAICLPRSPGLIEALLAVLAAGGVYLPLDPELPAERLTQLLADARAPWLLCQRQQVARLAPAAALAGCQLLAAGAAAADLDGIDGIDGIHPPSAGQLAYLIYTSGSTGRPRGVQVSHGALAAFVASAVASYRLTASDRLLQLAALSFDASVEEIFPVLAAGGTLCLVAGPLPSPRELLARAARLGLTVLDMTTAYWHTLIDTTLRTPATPALPPAVRLTLMGGEEARAESLAVWRREVAPRVRLLNTYGPTEATVVALVAELSAAHEPLPPDASGRRRLAIGRPMAHVRVDLVDRRLRPVAVAVPGEVRLAGAALARGYLGCPGATAGVFRPHPQAGTPGLPAGERGYHTGDLGRWRPDGAVEFLGRLDGQLKLRGFRVEPGEVEAQLASHPAVRQAAVVVPVAATTPRLEAWVVAGDEVPELERELLAFLRRRLPEFLVPAAIQRCAELPLTARGKVDRAALARRTASPAARPAAGPVPQGHLEQTVAAIWQEVLGIERVGRQDNFFDLGGHSLRLIAVQHRLEQALGREVPMVELFRHSTVQTLSRYLAGDAEVATPAGAGTAAAEATLPPPCPVAIVGMAGRFPGAADVAELWRNLCAGVESIRCYNRAELAAAGVNPQLLDDPDYVPALGSLDGVDLFDAGVFGLDARTARSLDPQQRLFLEHAWAALEDAGYDPRRFPGRIGVYAGASHSNYLLHLCADPELGEDAEALELALTSASETLPLRTSYLLDLKGPSVNVQTACSTSLVAVHLACMALADGSCELALAGGVAADGAGPRGYLHEPGGLTARDGHCRSYDAGAAGSVPGQGVGVVVLKRLETALADGDTVRAVILGSAINNDGARKVGFTAPSVDGQAAAIRDALARARVPAASIGYVEGHGSATPLGDPIEVRALIDAFTDPAAGAGPLPPGSCALGSVKSNVGHLDAAAGVTGLIKAALVVQHGRIPPSLHLERPNPGVDFAASPFRVNVRLRDWPAEHQPRRAGVSSFGLGGTNAHAVLEEPPPPTPANPGREAQLLVLSASSPQALEQVATRLADHLEAHPELPLADVAYTLLVGRTALPHRRAVLCRSREEALHQLRSANAATPPPTDPLAHLAHSWLAGHDLNVHDLFPHQHRRRVPLPTYPFERRRCWVDARPEVEALLDIEIGAARGPD